MQSTNIVLNISFGNPENLIMLNGVMLLKENKRTFATDPVDSFVNTGCSCAVSFRGRDQVYPVSLMCVCGAANWWPCALR